MGSDFIYELLSLLDAVVVSFLLFPKAGASMNWTKEEWNDVCLMYKFVLSPHAFIIYSAALSGRHKCQALGEISC